MAYTTSNEYEKIIYSGEATGNRIRIWFNEVELEDADNYCEKLSASSRLLPSSSSNRFSLDNFVSKELTLILHEVPLNRIVDQVKISLGTLVNGEYEDIPLGVFNIQDKPITDKDKITIKLRDNAIKFDFNYNANPIIDSNGGSATKLQIFEDICSKAGVNTKVVSFANSSDLIGIYDNTIKARAYIYYLAEQCGAIPTIDREGELIFVYINNLEVQRIPLSSIEKFEIGNKYRISKVIYEDAIRKYQSGNDDYDKLFLNSANPYISNQNQVNSIGSVVNGFEIDSLKTGKVLGNPAIDPYDIIEIYDDENNEELIIARTLANYSLTYNGVITNIYDTQIGLEARKENVSVNSEPTFKKWATTEINNLDASIKLSAGKISTLEEKTNPTGQASGSTIHITDSADAELLDFKLYGKSTQETRSGKNVFDLNKINTNYATSNGTGIDIANVFGNSVMYSSNVAQDFEPSTNYICTAKVKVVAKPSTLSTFNHNRILQLYNSNASPTTYRVLYASDDDSKNNWVVGNTYDLSCPFTTPSDLTGFNLLGYTYHGNNDGSTTYSANGELEITELMIRKATIIDDTFELYGVSPSPDYPSEMKSVGYQNLFNSEDWYATLKNINSTNMQKEVVNGIEYYKFRPANIYNYQYMLEEFEVNQQYTLSCKARQYENTGHTATGFVFCYTDGTTKSVTINSTTTEYDYKITSDANKTISYIRLSYSYNEYVLVRDLQLTKSNQEHNYIPFGKYGVEVNINNENLFNYEDTTTVTGGITTDENGWITITCDNTNGTSTKYFYYYTNPSSVLKTNTNYKLITEIKSVSGTGILFSASSLTTSQINNGASYNFNTLINNDIKIATFSTKSDFSSSTNMIRTYVQFKAGESGSVTFRISVLVDTSITADNFIYKPYGITTTLIELDEPLKGLTTQDYLYLQNSNLYLKKNVGEVVLNGSEAWRFVSNSHFQCVFNLGIAWTSTSTTVAPQGKCNRYICKSRYYVINATAGIDKSISMNASYIAIRDSNFTNLEDFKTWLSNNNVKVQYELAEPQDILIAENVDSLITYKNVTNISTNDDLQPNMEVVYVKDNTLNDIYQTQNGMNKYYTKVENDAQLEIVSDEIKSSVTEINTTIDTIRGAIETINQTMLTQTADQFEMLFKQTGIKELVDNVDALTKSNNATLVEQEQWIRFKGGNIELGRSDSQVKLLLSNDRISFLTGGNESAYISNNQLYITDSTILNKLQVGHWETKEENGNLNTRWIEGVI